MEIEDKEDIMKGFIKQMVQAGEFVPEFIGEQTAELLRILESLNENEK